MPPKRRSPRTSTKASTIASQASKAIKTTEKGPAVGDIFDLAESGHETDGDIEAEQIANVLNSATKRKSTAKKTESRLSFGIVGNMVRGFWGTNRADSASEAEEEELEVEQEGEDQVADFMEEASRVFPYVQTSSVEASPAKRSLDQISDVENPDEDESIEHPPKRGRGKGKGKGKKPLVAPRTSEGQTLQVVIRSPSGNNTSPTPKKRPGRKPVKKAQSKPKGAARASKKVASPAPSIPTDDQDSVIPAQQLPPRGQRKSTTTVQSVERKSDSSGVPPIDPQGYEEGFTEILMNPSPIKVTKPNSGAKPSHAPQKMKSKHGRPAKNYESMSDDEEENNVQNGVGNEDDSPLFVEDNESVENRKQREELTGSNELHHIVVDAELLDSLIEKARRVGHTQNRRTREWEDVSGVKKISTQGGEKIHRLLERLSSSYKTLKASKSEDDGEVTDEAKADVATRLQRLAEYATRMVSTRLDGKADEYMVTRLLKDLYFFIFPDWLDCIQLASECYNENGAMTRHSLQEMHTLLNSYCELAESAISQPTNIQPKGDYQTSKPTREVLPHIHKLRRQFQKKVAPKSHTPATVRDLQLQIERERKRLEEEFQDDQPIPSVEDEEVKRLKLELAKVHREREEKKERERRQRINEIRRKQAEQIREALERENIQYIGFEGRGSESLGRSRVVSRTEDLQHRLASLTHEEGEEDDPFSDNYVPRQNGRTASVDLEGDQDEGDEDEDEDEDEYEVERIEVFPHNNKNLTTPMPWSDDQKLTFIKCMIRGGNDKYERAAEKLQCSMDDVFAAAKELQEAHDKAHAAGLLNGPNDGWTYDVWNNNGE